MSIKTEERSTHKRKFESCQNKVFITGHPNVGKTSLYNSLTNSNLKVMNYSGSTVSTTKKQVPILHGNDQIILEFYDTPGMSSIIPSSKDEAATWDSLKKYDLSSDVLIFVVDPMQLGKQLVLFKQIKQTFQGQIILVLNYGCATSPTHKFDSKELKRLLGSPACIIESGDDQYIQSLRKEILNSFSILQKKKAPHLSSLNAFSTQPRVNDITVPTENEICAHYKWAEKIVLELTPNSKEEGSPKIAFLDRIFLHPFYGLTVFLLLMSGFFWSLFGVATPVMDSIESGVGALQYLLRNSFSNTFISELLFDGVLSGIGAVLVFVPQIFLLFFGLGVLEQSGFLARGALIIDKPLSKVGLSGKSFLPLLSGFACAIPAFLASRSIPQRKERLITQILIPLMTCSARLPVYGLLVSLLFFGESAWSKGVIMTSIYLISIIVAAFIALLLSKIWKKNPLDQSVFHIDLPSWRRPLLKDIFISSLKKACAFILKAGPHIVWISLTLWVLSNVPSKENSIAMSFGKWFEPLFYPMGIDWRIAVALMFAFAAREVFIPALVLVFSFHPDTGAWDQGIISSLQGATFEGTTELIFIPSTVIGLLGFFMISLQCLSTVAVAKGEMGGWKKPLIMMAVYTMMGYVVSVVLVQTCRFLGLS